MSGALAAAAAGGAAPGGGGAGASFSGATVTFQSNGLATGTGTYVGATNWYAPTTAGIGFSRWVRVTRTSGLSFTNEGAWQVLGSGVTYSVSGGAGTSQGIVDFSTDSGGATIVSSGTISVSNIG